MKAAIIGTGYVGLVTGACLAHTGHKIVCVDKDKARIDKLSQGLTPFFEPDLDNLVKETFADGRLRGSTDIAEAMQGADVVLIAVGTPDRDGQIDLSQIETAAEEIGAALRDREGYCVVAVKSTVVPGTTDGVVLNAVKRTSGKELGRDFGLCMNPEFLREGSAIDDFMTPDRIVIGAHDERSAEVFGGLYSGFDCPKPVVSLRNAEMTKYASNALLATLISFSNEIASLCEATPGTDVEVAFDSVHLDHRLSPIIDGKRISPGILSYIRPSSGYGGSCFPKDVTALRAFADARGVETNLLDAVSDVNARRTSNVVDIAESRTGAFKGKRVGVLGLAFKAGTDDLRHSPAITLVNEIINRGADTIIYDPIATDLARPLFGDKVDYASSALDVMYGADIVVVGTGWPEWNEIDWTEAKGKMRGNVLFDARNALRHVELPPDLIRLAIGAGA